MSFFLGTLNQIENLLKSIIYQNYRDYDKNKKITQSNRT